MQDKNCLAFDLGAESGRAVLGTLSGAKLTLAEKHRFANPTGRMDGHLHWNLLGQWEELKTGLRNAGAKLDGIGVDTWGVDFGLLAGDGEILGNPYHYRDTRTDGMLELAISRAGKEKIFQTTGIQFMQLNSLYQLLAMRQNKSPILDAAHTLLFMPDLFHYLFTGRKAAEFSIASTSQMYDPKSKQWAMDLLDELDLPARILPEIIPSGTLLGQLRSDVAEECGVDGAPVIAPASHDTASAVVAVPADGDDWCYISSGTWSLMGVEIPHPIINDKSLKFNYTNEGGINGSIRFLKNIMGLWLVQECRRQFQREHHDYDYAQLTQMAAAAESSALINPDYPAFLRPDHMPQKIEQFCRETKQKVPSSHGQLIRVCLESLALTYRRTLDILEEILGRKIRTIHIVGGGAKNELLNQMTADACGRPVIAGPFEATAIGNILVQAMATGDVKSLEDARSIVRSSFDVKRYEPTDAKLWDGMYGKFREVVASY